MHPILFQIGPITVRYYGLMYVIAITLGFFLLSTEVRRKRLELSTDNLLDLLLWQGGLAIHGGVLVGILVVYLFSRLKKVQFWALTDALAPSLILGQAIGRIGNFTNGDAFGLPTTLPWGIHFPAGSPAGMAFPGQATHPSMVYEMLLNLAIFAFLWGIRKKGFRDGFSTAMYFILYAGARSIVSFTRADSLWLGPIRAAHAISIVFVILFGVMIWRRKLYVTELESSSGRKLSPK